MMNGVRKLLLVVLLVLCMVPTAFSDSTGAIHSVVARADELAAHVQACPLEVFRHTADGRLQEYVKSKNLCAREFLLGEALYLMKLANVVDMRDISCDAFSRLQHFQMMQMPALFVPPPDSVKAQTERIMAHCLVTGYGGAPPEYRYWLLRQLSFFPPCEAERIDAFLANCAPIRSDMLDANLARAFLSNSIDMHTLEVLGSSRLLIPADLPDNVKAFWGRLPDPRDTTVPPESIRDSISTLISRNLPVLDVLAAQLVRLYMRPLGASPAWDEFILTRAPSDIRLEYTWFFAGQNTEQRPPREVKVDILRDAVAHGVGANRDFEDLIFKEDERLFILAGALGRNDLSNALMRGLGRHWATAARAKDLKENHATLEFIKKIEDRDKDETLYSVLCAILEYVTGAREGRDPQAEAVITAILDRATTSPDKKTEYLARTIKQAARYYNWSFVEPPAYRSGIDMVDYMYLTYTDRK